MTAEFKVEEPEIVLVSPGRSGYPDGPCGPMQGPCNPQCAPACMPNSIPCNPRIPCYPDVGRPPAPPRPGPNLNV